MKLAPNTQKYSVQECGRAGGILGILNELNKGGLINGSAYALTEQRSMRP